MSVSTAAPKTALPLPRPILRAVPPRKGRAGRGAFFAIVAAVLSLGLIALLGINTLLAQGSFVVHDLEAQVAELGDRQSALEEEVADLASPRRLAEKARSLGMVQAENPAFLRLSDGAVLGEPLAAEAPPPPRAEAAPQPAAPVDPAVTAPVDPTAPAPDAAVTTP